MPPAQGNLEMSAHLNISSLSLCGSLSNDSNPGSDTNCLTTALEKSFYLLSRNSAFGK